MVNRLLFVVLPVSLLVMPHVFHLACADSGFYFAKESGAVETITAVLLALAIVAVLHLLAKLLTISKPANTHQRKTLRPLDRYFWARLCLFLRRRNKLGATPRWLGNPRCLERNQRSE